MKTIKPAEIKLGDTITITRTGEVTYLGGNWLRIDDNQSVLFFEDLAKDHIKLHPVKLPTGIGAVVEATNGGGVRKRYIRLAPDLFATEKGGYLSTHDLTIMRDITIISEGTIL